MYLEAKIVRTSKVSTPANHIAAGSNIVRIPLYSGLLQSLQYQNQLLQLEEKLILKLMHNGLFFFN